MPKKYLIEVIVLLPNPPSQMLHSVGPVLACLTLLLCFASNSLQVSAQNSEILSARPPVIKIFDRDKNESTISALLFNPQSTFDPLRTPPALRLHSVEYRYPGIVFSRPKDVAFVFLPSDKYEAVPNFVLTADDTVLHEGEAMLREMCCVEINGRSENPQHIVVAVPLETLERLTQARKVELKLNSKRGKYSFKLNDYQRKCLGALASTSN
jgi:hypothetical protein